MSLIIQVIQGMLRKKEKSARRESEEKPDQEGIQAEEGRDKGRGEKDNDQGVSPS